MMSFAYARRRRDEAIPASPSTAKAPGAGTSKVAAKLVWTVIPVVLFFTVADAAQLMIDALLALTTK
jgi:hypothetical protein